MPKTYFLQAEPEDFDRSIDLNGSNEYFARDNNEFWNIFNVWSISLWALSDTSGGSEHILHVDDLSLGRNEIGIRRKDASTHMVITNVSNVGGIIKQFQFDNFWSTSWTHLVATWDGTDLRVYKNSVLQVPDTKIADVGGTMDDQQRSLWWGAQGAPAQFWEGNLGGLAWWGVQLDQDDIDEIFNPATGKPLDIDLRSNVGTYDKSSSLEHYYRHSATQIGSVDLAANRSLVNFANLTIADDISTDTPA